MVVVCTFCCHGSYWLLKRAQCKQALWALSTGMESKVGFLLIYGLVCSKSTFESRENTTVRGAISCLAIFVMS